MAGERLDHEILFGRFVVHQPQKDSKSAFLQVRVRDLLTGRTRKRSTRTTSKRAARQFVLDWLSSVVNADSGAVERVRLSEAAAVWLEQREVRESTRADLRNSIDRVYSPAFGRADTCDVSGADVQDLLASLLRKGRSWRTRRKHLKNLRNFFDWAIVRGLAERNPTDGISIAPGEKFEGRALSTEEARALLVAAKNAPKCRHAFLALLIAAHTGLRRGNILRLEWHHLDLDARRVDLPSSEMKGKRRHTMPLHKELVSLLEREREDSNSPRVIGVEVKEIKGSVATAIRVSGIGPVRLHDLRHSFATWLRAHCPEDIVARLLGHATRGVTRAYIHREWQDLERAIDRLPNLLGSEP